MNLWVLDERLVYHHYLASDLALKKMTDAVTVASTDRPDLIIFHAPSAFVESAPPFNSVTIIEFKRPVPDDYNGDDNPISQVYAYIERIRDGKAKDRNGRPITIPDRTPFFAYIVCDLTPTCKRQAKAAGFRQTADAAGYFGYNDNYGVYVDIVPFEKTPRRRQEKERDPLRQARTHTLRPKKPRMESHGVTSRKEADAIAPNAHKLKGLWSGKRDSNPRRPAWEIKRRL
ncbi:MAG: hypothetical protein IT167_23060 [Bryobacterales bacterium]|nr:hypothetical protein [Bryobacterales bacterium]